MFRLLGCLKVSGGFALMLFFCSSKLCMIVLLDKFFGFNKFSMKHSRFGVLDQFVFLALRA